MAKFNEYPVKATPEDNDTLMIYDAAAKANKLSPFSGIWNWMVGKLTNAAIANLQTNNKTVLGAINELNSKLNTKADNANAYRLKTFGTVPQNSDLNTYLTPGTYGQSNSSTAQTIKNLPYSASPWEFKLIVEYFFNNEPSYIMQKLYRWNSCEYYIRESTDAGKTWNAWKKFAKTTV